MVDQVVAERSVTLGQMNDNFFVISRAGKERKFDSNKIYIAIDKAFAAVFENKSDIGISRQRIVELTQNASSKIIENFKDTGHVSVEDIQDQVIRTLMNNKEYEVVQAYILYRKEREDARYKQQEEIKFKDLTSDKVEVLNSELLEANLTQLFQGLEHVSAREVVGVAYRNMYNGIKEKDILQALLMASRANVEVEPNYSKATSRLLLTSLYQEASEVLGIQSRSIIKDPGNEKIDYADYFNKFLKYGVDADRLDKRLLDFDLDQLAKAIKHERDYLFSYLGLQTLYDRYFIHSESMRYELPQVFFMRVAMGLCLNEDKTEDATATIIKFYNLLSSFDYMSSTPTLFNSGTTRPQLSSCFLTTIDDDLHAIFKGVGDNAALAKFSGGLGNDWTRVRARGTPIKGTNGLSSGTVPFLKVMETTAIAVNQGGKRKGAVCAFLEVWHLDIKEFLELRKNTGDDRLRTPDMNTACWVPDLFMERVFENSEWTLFCPSQTTDLHETYGLKFKEIYQKYEVLAENNKIRSEKINARDLWRKMLNMLYETGHPWITFKDAFNLRSPQQHCGVIHNTNLCTEISLNNSNDEVAVCNLGSINLCQHIDNGVINDEKLMQTVEDAIRMLDNVIDINYYTIPEAKNSNLKHRPIGLGIMGFHDALYQMNIPYDSEEAIEFSDIIMEKISYYAIRSSMQLAKARGAYSTFKGSLWEQGILPIDSIKILQRARGEHCLQDTSSTMDWASLRKDVQKYGVRNSNILAIAPTATIANICGISASVDPTYRNLYVKSNMSGEFTVVNEYLIEDLKKLDLWDKAMINDLKYYNGSVQSIERIPKSIKLLYKTAFEIKPEWLIECGSRRQKWVDQSQSLNLYFGEPSGKILNQTYRKAWLMGLKSTYYCRSVEASSVEKSTITDHRLNNVKSQVCDLDGDCEACQ
jgi:ribonucleoside-diphosphate reductase alpha chain